MRLLGVVLAALSWLIHSITGDTPVLYFYAQGNLQDSSFLHMLLGWMSQAAGCGYTKMFYADSGLQTLHIPGSSNATFHAALAEMWRHGAAVGIGIIPLIYPFGPSNPIFAQPGWGYSLAEPLSFRNAPFVVSPDRSFLIPSGVYEGPTDGDFDAHDGNLFTFWHQDAPGVRTFAATGRACLGGSGACLQIGPGTGDAEVWQELKGLAPLTQVHVSFWARSEGFEAMQYNVEVRCFLLSSKALHSKAARGRRLSWWPMSIAATQDWTRYDFVASSWDCKSPVALFVGVEARSYGDTPSQRGTIWFDNVKVQQIALFNTLRREGAPLRAYSADKQDLVEGKDFKHVTDPQFPSGEWPAAGEFSTYHEPPTVALPTTTSLHAGDRVWIDYYAVIPVFGSAPSCLLHQGIFEYMQQSAASIAALEPTGMLLSYDEIRVMRNDATEVRNFESPGELLAWHVRNATFTARNSSKPDTELYIWDDMFNPYHNAGGDPYFLVNGSLQGSWEGLDPMQISMVTWGPCDDTQAPRPGQPPCRFREGLRFFAARGLRQVIGGYYDTHNGTLSAQKEWKYAAGIDGILGFSYTTWGSNNPQNGYRPDYTQMCPYASEIRRLAAEFSAMWKWV